MPEIIKPLKNLPERSKAKIESLLKVCETKKDFLNQFNPDFCSNRYEALNTEELALKSGMIKLSDVKLAYDYDVPIYLIRAWLINAAVYVRLEIDSHLIKDIASELYKEIHMLNIAEFTLFFSKLKRGHYGTLYGRFDGMMICSAAREYRQQRGMIFSKLPENEQKALI